MGPLFAAIERTTTPVPVVDAPLVTLIHDVSARADHAQSDIAVTPIRATAPPTPTSTRVLSRRNAHGAPSCASSRRVDSIVNVPRRAFAVSFVVILKGRLASPWPLDRSTTSQEASEPIVQLHSRALVTAMLPEPPVCGKERGDVVADTSHFVALGAVVEVDADVQAVTKRTRPANAAARHRTLRQTQIACQSDDVSAASRRPPKRARLMSTTRRGLRN